MSKPRPHHEPVEFVRYELQRVRAKLKRREARERLLVKQLSDAWSKVTITLEPRPDGGIRVYSKDLPGLILSGADVDAVMLDILPAVRVLQEHAAIRKGEA